MQRSNEVRDALVRSYDRLNAKDVAAFDDVVSLSPEAVIVGTAPGEIVRERPRLRFGFETEGLRLEAKDPVGSADGSMGWAMDEPRFVFPDGSGMRVRLTAVMIREDGKWKLVHGHFSVGVPDDEVVDLQKRWGTND